MTQPSGPDYGNMAGRMAGPTPISDLSPTMIQTLRVLRHYRWRYREAAQALNINENTARSRVKSMVEKTGCRSRAELGYWLGVMDSQAGRVTQSRG